MEQGIMLETRLKTPYVSLCYQGDLLVLHDLCWASYCKGKVATVCSPFCSICHFSSIEAHVVQELDSKESSGCDELENIFQSVRLYSSYKTVNELPVSA